MQNENLFLFSFPKMETYHKIQKMNPLNLPPFDIKLKGTPEKQAVYDVLRRKYVALTPEEWVRQHFIHFLISQKHFPQSLLANEVKLQVGNKTLRADSVLYDKNLHPRMIVEYKAPHIQITQKVFEQITAYNSLLHVDYLIVSNGMSHFCCRINYADNAYEFLKDIPDYSEL